LPEGAAINAAMNEENEDLRGVLPQNYTAAVIAPHGQEKAADS